MITDRQVAESAFQSVRFFVLAAGALSLCVLAYAIFQHLTGLGSALPGGLALFCLIAMPFLIVFHGFGLLIRWIVLGFISDKERKQR